MSISYRYMSCQSVEGSLYPAGSTPFLYDVRVQTDALSSMFGRMTGYLNRPDVRRALHAPHPFVQMDGGAPGSLDLNASFSEILHVSMKDVAIANPLGTERERLPR